MSGNGLNVMHFNIRGLVNKVNELENILASANEQSVLVHVILLRETFLKDMNEKYCQIQDYELITTNRPERIEDGVAIYVHRSIDFSQRKDLGFFVEGKIESLFIEMKVNRKPLIVGEIYRFPKVGVSQSIESYSEILRSTSATGKDSIIGTDQNIDLLTHQVACQFEMNLVAMTTLMKERLWAKFRNFTETDIRHQIKKRLYLIVNSTFKMGPLAIAVVLSSFSLVAGKKCANEMNTDSGGVQVIVNYLTSDQATCETSSSILERIAALEREVDFLKHAGAESGAGEGCGCPSGPPGPPGRVGPSGPRGPRGLKGARGTFGGTGATGFRGSTGVGGRDGAPGAPGAPGRTGSTGATGYQGQTGATGWLGRTGAGPS
ncbi:hypothetical protein CAPTEDRAFT_186770 [Capitella teleta]|uniref:Uncharacterized protein n=1 Tax=Capitella teleta TaxID=283909 RepID=R7V3R8_CAPTE|nr:hypothetical protein CAPTEDRAFT_186770 [Capitella teleta]|eukprot:ELU10455.1 hypothetical protein CAPTEDRAFT_186770 [Capitella teleta]